MKALRHLLQRSMGARMVALFLGVLFAVQIASFSALRASLSEHAHRSLPARLDVGDRVFQSLLDQRAQKLIDGARLLAADYGFREALSSNDADTIVLGTREPRQPHRRDRVGAAARPTSGCARARPDTRTASSA